MTPTRRGFLSLGAGAGFALGAAAAARPNILLITADDMNWDAPGCFGNRIPNITPNIDRLAAQGMRFEHAHVTVAVCQPCRSVLMTGRYPHRNGAEGFQPIREDVPTLQEQLRGAGYLNGIFSKTEHLAPQSKFCWDYFKPPAEMGSGRDPSLYHRHTAEFLKQAKAAGKPFFLMANSTDPHRPFAGSDQEAGRQEKKGKKADSRQPVRRTLTPAEVRVPGFLPDIPEVRREVAEYYTSVYRCDETVGRVLQALGESGLEQNTLVMFLSDNGMSFPYSKTNCYRDSTRTPWIVRWPGRVKPGQVENRHMISGIDFTPTVLEAGGIRQIPGTDGRSFVPVLEGRAQTGREQVVTVFHETSGRQRFEMRSIQTLRFGYLFNAWSDGKRIFRNESQNGRTFAAMREAAKTDARIAARVDFFLKRVPEEFYDYQADPHALNNLIGDVRHKPEIERLRRELQQWMKRTEDPLAAVFQERIKA
ncbi:MAG: sulfatase [Bryobacterales bacterium]|nr:sulfatase [Bryobacterales bacterium]